MACRAILWTGYSSEVNYHVLKSNWKEATTWPVGNGDRVQVKIRDDKITQIMVRTGQIKIIILMFWPLVIASSQQNSSIIPEINMCISSPKTTDSRLLIVCVRGTNIGFTCAHLVLLHRENCFWPFATLKRQSCCAFAIL